MTSTAPNSFSDNDFVLFGPIADGNQASNSQAANTSAPNNTVDSSVFDPTGHNIQASGNNSCVNTLTDNIESANNQTNLDFEYPTAHLNPTLVPNTNLSNQSHFLQNISAQFATMSPEDRAALERSLGYPDQGVDGDFGSLARTSFTPINGQDNSNTVSPQELFMDHSAPNSNVMTNLTTPSMYDTSPDDMDSYVNSPLFEDSNNVGRSHWPSLFENDSALYAPAEISSSTESLEKVHQVDPVSISMDRTISTSSMNSATQGGTSERPGTAHGQHRLSLTSGVTKNRRTGRDLPVIEVDEGDSKALKRAKNTMAARKSRQKKRDIEDTLRDNLEHMTAERDRWMHLAIAHGAPIPETKVPKRSSTRDNE